MKRILQLACILLLALSLNACRTVQGGGWMESASGEGKATFGVKLNCEAPDYYGEFTYHDHGVKMEMPDGKMRKLVIQARVIPDHETSCSDQNPEYTLWYFNYLAQPNKYGSSGFGSGWIEFFDADRSEDPSDEDELLIQIINGPFAGYYNAGEIGGGNLTIYDE